MKYLNDGTPDAPKLKVYLNTDNLTELPESSEWFKRNEGCGLMETLQSDGFQGIQAGDGFEIPSNPTLPFCGLDRINLPEQTEAIFETHKNRGDSCITLHVGWGIEDDATIDRLITSILAASESYQLPAFIETHRATITQDIWRTVELTKRFPEILFNGDFSHYYCGQEMVYGGVEMKMEFMQPIFDRIAFMHGRIASSGFMQAPVDGTDEVPRAALGIDYLADFKNMWIRAMRGFKQQASTGDVLIFAPELLRPTIYYARTFEDAQGRMIEETDRYAQALLYKNIARECWEQA